MRSLLPRPRAAGFSLTELVVVLAVISLIAAIAVPTFSAVRTNAARSVAQASAESVARNALALAVQDPSSHVVSADLFGDKLLVSSREANGIMMLGDDGTSVFQQVSTPAGIADRPNAVFWTLSHDNGNDVDVFFDPDDQQVWVREATPGLTLPVSADDGGELDGSGVLVDSTNGSEIVRSEDSVSLQFAQANWESVTISFDLGDGESVHTVPKTGSPSSSGPLTRVSNTLVEVDLPLSVTIEIGVTYNGKSSGTLYFLVGIQ